MRAARGEAFFFLPETPDWGGRKEVMGKTTGDYQRCLAGCPALSPARSWCRLFLRGKRRSGGSGGSGAARVAFCLRTRNEGCLDNTERLNSPLGGTNVRSTRACSLCSLPWVSVGVIEDPRRERNSGSTRPTENGANYPLPN